MKIKVYNFWSYKESTLIEQVELFCRNIDLGNKYCNQEVISYSYFVNSGNSIYYTPTFHCFITMNVAEDNIERIAKCYKEVIEYF